MPLFHLCLFLSLIFLRKESIMLFSLKNVDKFCQIVMHSKGESEY